MCGIAGFYSPKKGNEQQVIDGMLDTIEHRGPDDRNTLLLDNITLGHVRLSIIDIDNGKQPMPSPDGRYHIVFNGEIYNYLELRQQLVSKGHQLTSFSDTEVLLHMYMEYGKTLLDHINGMFAFAIYDKHEQEFFIARDHFGIKPFYFHQSEDSFIFASEIKALLAHPEVPCERDMDGIYEYLTFQMVLNGHSMFKDIQKLPPAHFMVVKEGKVVEQKEYWSVHYAINEEKDEDRFADELLVLLESSLSIQTRSDVPVGAYLSGGLDSSIVATLAAKNYFGTFKTFTGGFSDGAEYDETRYAKLISKHISSEHHEIFPEPRDFTDNFEKLVYHMDEPAAGPGLFPQYMVSKKASEHVKVVLGGQGGDEIYGGYARYAVAYLEQCLKGSIMETQEEGSHVVTLSSIIPNMPMLKQYLPLMRKQFSKGLFEPMDKRYYSMIDRSPNLDRLYDGAFLSGRDEEKIFENFSGVFNNPETKSYFNKMTYYDMKTLLPALLQVEDRVSMAVSLESRVPLLDKRIIELATQMPPTMKFAGGKTKAMLLKAVENILPKEIVQRKDKMGFPTPFNLWMKGPLKEFVLDIMTSQAAKERGLFKTADIDKMINNNDSFGRELWGALNLEVWHRQFIDG